MRCIFVITGPTSAGKSAASLVLRDLNALFHIVNADSKQVYAELPVLTSQIPKEEGSLFAYISVFSQERVTVSSWLRDCSEVCSKVWSAGKIPLIVGGTPMYIHSLLNGISVLPPLPDSLIAELSRECDRIGSVEFSAMLKERFCIGDLPNDKYKLLRNASYLFHTGKTIEQLYQSSTIEKIDCDFIDLTALIPNRELLYRSIDEHFVHSLGCGAIDEVKALLGSESVMNNPRVTTICGFREISSYIRSETTFEHMVIKSQQSIRNYAKRQLTWFRNKFPGMRIFDNSEGLISYIHARLNQIIK